MAYNIAERVSMTNGLICESHRYIYTQGMLDNKDNVIEKEVDG